MYQQFPTPPNFSFDPKLVPNLMRKFENKRRPVLKSSFALFRCLEDAYQHFAGVVRAGEEKRVAGSHAEEGEEDENRAHG